MLRTGEIDVEVLSDSHPVGHQLQRNDIEKTLQTVDGLGQLNLLAGLVPELLIVLVADNDRPTATGNNYKGQLNLLLRRQEQINLPCWYAFRDFLKMPSRDMIMMIGKFSSTNASTPCFNSPDITASQCR
jgi:hypothetical protein